MTYDVERVVLGGGVSHAGETFAHPIQRELDRLRAASALAREQLPADIVDLLPPGADAGAWGAVTIAAAHAGSGAGQGSEEVGHVREPMKVHTAARPRTDQVPHRNGALEGESTKEERSHSDQRLTALACACCSSSAAGAGQSPAAPRRPRRPPRPRPPSAAPPRARAASAAAAAEPRRSRRIRPKPSSRTSSRAPRSAFWTFFLSPTFDQYIKDTIARFEATYPGVKVKWEDHQATFQDDLNNAFAAGNAPDVINLSVSEGWVSDYATRACCSPRQHRPEGRPGHLLPGPLERAARRRRELPVPVVPGPQRRADQQEPSTRRPASTVDQFPKTIEGSRPCARPSSRRPDACATIRLTVNDLLAQMVYEGNVKVFSPTTASLHLQLARGRRLAPDVRRHGHRRHRRQHRPDHQRRPRRPQRLLGRPAAFYATGPNLVREVKDTNATLYDNLAMVPSPLGKSGVVGQGPDVDLGQEVAPSSRTRPSRSRSSSRTRGAWSVLQAGRGLPVVAVGVRRPVLRAAPTAIEDSAPAARRRASSRPTRTSSRRSRRRPTSTRSSSRRSSRRCSTRCPPSRP